MVADDDEILDAEVVEDGPNKWPLYDAALDYLAHGWTPTPLRAKRPTQRRWVGLKPSGADCWAWWVEDNHDGIGIVCGAISRQLIVVDLESELVADREAMVQVMLAATALGAGDWITAALNNSSATTPSHGLHLYYEVTDGETVPGNEKLAFRGAGDQAVLLAETRGEGGQVAAPPGNGRQWRGASGPGIATQVTHAQLQGVFDAFRTLDQSGIKREPPKPRKPWTGDSHREPTVADAWIAPLMSGAITWADILDEGWVANRYDSEGRSLWVRPDYGHKTRAPYSAKGFERWVAGPTPVLVNHSSSVVHLPTGEGQRLTPARVWARCHFGGDEAAANAALEALATTGELDPRIDRPPPTPVINAARAIIAERDTRRQAADEWLDNLPTTAAIDTTIEDQLFNATDTLAHIRTAARARLVSPWALLAATLARIVAEIPPWVALPAIIGTRASLNLYAAIVGPSGAAKTTAVAVADDLLDLGKYALAVVQGSGSGEGLINSFLTADPEQKGKLVLTEHPHICLSIDEIGQIGAIQTRQGSTLAPVLRSGWSGSNLDTINADPTRRRRVPKNSYRLTAVAGVQPLAARILFDDADTGTPQRWLWMPALDPHMPEQEPDWPGQLRWRQPDGSGHRDHHGHVTLTVAEPIRAALRAAHRARHHGQASDLLDGHLALTQLKVAAALAALHGSLDVDEAVWGLAGIVMGVSGHVRDDVQRQLAADRDAQARGRGHADHLRDIGRVEAANKTVAKDAVRVWKIVDAHADGRNMGSAKHRPDEGCTRRCVAAYVSRRTPEQRAAAVDHATDMTWIVTESDRFRPGPSRPAEGV